MTLEKPARCFREFIHYDSAVFNILAPHIERGNVLSVGCGEGRVEHMLQEQCGISVVGAEVMRYRYHRIPVRLYDGSRLPFRKNEFDTTLFVYVLHHSKGIEPLLKEAMRVTKRNILILDHTYTNTISGGMLKAYDYFSNVLYRMPIPLNFLCVKEWFSLFRKLGLRVEEADVPTSLNVFFKLAKAKTARV